MTKITKCIIVTAVIMAVLMITGLQVKQTYKDFNKEIEPLKNFQVGVLSEELLDIQLELMESLLEEQNIVIAVTCQDTFEYHFRCVTQPVKIEHVFKGENLSVGEIISIARVASELFFELEMDEYAINMNFVNEMIPGKKYLIFLDYEMDVPQVTQKIYSQSDIFIMAPIFCYDEIVNTPCKMMEEYGNSSLYEDVKENEFFLETKSGIEKMKQFKKALLESYSFEVAEE